jgi:dTMP kinase
VQSRRLQRGLFFTFEGGEGSGKTTLQQKLSSYLTSLEYSVVNTRAPGGTALGAAVRDILLYKEKIQLCKQAELFLFLADRAQHVEEVIGPALEQKKIVLCDRFNDSTIAYQGGARHGDLSFIEQLCSFAVHDLIPDLTLYLDIDPQQGLKRAKQAIVTHAKSSYDRLEQEKIDFHERVRHAYLALAKKWPQRIHVVEATQSADQVFSDALTKILAHIEEESC